MTGRRLRRGLRVPGLREHVALHVISRGAVLVTVLVLALTRGLPR